MEKSWKEAIIKVLRESETPLHYTDITEQIFARSYYRTEGATPAATVNAQLASSIKHDGMNSPFIRISKGTFALREATSDNNTSNQNTNGAGNTEAEQPEYIIRALGMYWQRDSVVWKGDTKLLGKQQASSKAVDFGKQRGIYILYDHHTVIYVGRTTDRPLGKRLYEHTLDRLSGRWDRFSWFGLLDVTSDGSLKERNIIANQTLLISTLESILIETLEPPQNRKRGEDLSAVEYIQERDPELKGRQVQATLRMIEQRLNQDF